MFSGQIVAVLFHKIFMFLQNWCVLLREQDAKYLDDKMGKMKNWSKDFWKRTQDLDVEGVLYFGFLVALWFLFVIVRLPLGPVSDVLEECFLVFACWYCKLVNPIANSS